ncbi:MAG: thioredoxin domain-containing protein [Aliarcobacter sp.]|jgi:protein-disulfide isomerase|nr:thioredoxin domain-containing protein [Aliarcobacter sp.]
MQNKKLVGISLLVLIVLFIGLAYFYKNNQTQKETLLISSSNKSLVTAQSVSFGENKKNITIVEFLDPECESCAVFHPIMRKVYKEHYSDIKLVIRYLANHKNSKYAIKILEASREQNKYEEVLSLIFEKQPLWAEHNNEKPELIWTFLTQIEGLNIDKLKEDMKNPKIDEIIDNDAKDARILSVKGTPTVFVNEKKLERLSQKDLFDLVESEIYK